MTALVTADTVGSANGQNQNPNSSVTVHRYTSDQFPSSFPVVKNIDIVSILKTDVDPSLCLVLLWFYVVVYF